MNSNTFSPASRVWIYTADRPLDAKETEVVLAKSQDFVQQWTAHQQQLQAKAILLEQRFLVLVVDESRAGASGCSIDKSVHFVQMLGQMLGLDFLNRTLLSCRDPAGRVQTMNRQDFQSLYRQGLINEQTIVFDPLVKNYGELQTSFEKPLNNSWHQRML